MIKLRRAIWAFVMVRFVPSRKRAAAVHGITLWLLQITGALKRRGWLTIGAGGRIQIADWVLTELMTVELEADEIISILLGDEFAEKNKKDIARLEKKTGRSVMALWDTDPIFIKFPHLRGLARNEHFEKVVWPMVKESWGKQK